MKFKMLEGRALAVSSAVCWGLARVDRLLVLGLSVHAPVLTLPPPMQAQLAPQWQTGRFQKFLFRVASRLFWRSRSFFRAMSWRCSSTELGRLSDSGSGVGGWPSSWSWTDLSPSRGLCSKSRVSELNSGGMPEGMTGSTVVFAPAGVDGRFHFQKVNLKKFMSLDLFRRCLLPCSNFRMRGHVFLGGDWVVGPDASFRTLTWDPNPLSSLWESWWGERLGPGRIDWDGLDRVGLASSTLLSWRLGRSALVQLCKFDGRKGLL